MGHACSLSQNSVTRTVASQQICSFSYRVLYLIPSSSINENSERQAASNNIPHYTDNLAIVTLYPQQLQSQDIRKAHAW